VVPKLTRVARHVSTPFALFANTMPGAASAIKLHLAKHSRPSVVTLPSDGSSSEASGRTLLVDGASVQAHLLDTLGVDTAPHMVYAATCAYVKRLQATGLKLLVVLSPGAPSPSHEAAVASTCRAHALARTPASPASVWAINSAFGACGCDVRVAASSTHTLVLSYLRRHAPSVFALLTQDADFFVLGVRARRQPRTGPNLGAALPRRTKGRRVHLPAATANSDHSPQTHSTPP
jgi:hypothetical protein